MAQDFQWTSRSGQAKPHHDRPHIAGLDGAFVVATTPDGDDVAYLDNQLQGHVVSHGPDVLSLLRTWESVRAEALPPGRAPS
ncbi:Scr1 family TA system antitoxin-like transcriptional regulator [Micromonospora sp. H33]|uniref:Scr1 family TA system antitoxin-like transcriptional regulator n=1 Tax=Micromonospora sp. H33 TaxID=3452215 RepID=UPI003F896820